MKHISESIIGKKGNGGITKALPRKENLDEGDIVQWRNGEYRMFMTTDFFGNANICTGFCEDVYLCDIRNFDKNLKCLFDRDIDVIKIFKTSQLPNISLKFPTYTQNELEKIVKNGII